MRSPRNRNLPLLLVAAPLALATAWHVIAAAADVVAWHVEYGPQVAGLALLEVAGVLP